MRISPAQASKLLDLQRGATLRRSEIQKDLRDDLLRRGALRLLRSGAGYRIVAEPAKLETVLENQYSIRNLSGFVELRDEKDRSRAALTRTTGNSKGLPVAPMRGLYLGVLGDAKIFIEGKPSTPQPGTALFVPISRLTALTIRPLRILGVENVEAFLNAERLNLPLPPQAVNVLRWNWGEEWRAWIGHHHPEVLYAGDYDWAGVSIFEGEVLPTSAEAKFLVPDDLQERLQNGNASLFLDQEEKYRDYKPLSIQGEIIYRAVNSARKVLEQEALIQRGSSLTNTS